MIDRYVVKYRTYDCHPETCAHWEHNPYYLWDNKLCRWYLGYDTEAEAIASAKTNNNYERSLNER